MKFTFTKLSLSEMDPFISVVNSNYHMIQPHLTNKYQHQAYLITDLWVQKNFSNHTFYRFHDPTQEEKTIGCISIKKIADFAYFEYFFIHQQFNRQGYGRIMMRLAESEVKKLGVKKIRLFVHKNAPWAHSAYQKYGFTLLLSDKTVIRNYENGRLAPHFLVNHLLYEKVLL